MKLLMTMQALDRDDPVLGVYHEWARAIAGNVEILTVICLKEGKHDLPENVRVHSLGKEHGAKSPLAYALRFLGLAWTLRKDYEAVFVHMNQEYLLIADWLWLLLGKRTYLWRNHYSGSFLTDLATMFCTKTFCTSTHSYIAKYRKNVIMPVGVDLERFGRRESTTRVPRSILFFSRIAPSKRADLLLDAFAILHGNNVAFSATVCGSPLPEYEAYATNLITKAREQGLVNVSFHPGVPNAEAPALYERHDIYVNCSPSGMLDKTIFEAAASGCIVVAASDDWNKRTGDAPFTNARTLADRISHALGLTSAEAHATRVHSAAIARREGLEPLATRLIHEMS
jgi:glycosyltransferase involved in cell wall biosynthesis